jgi:hypothetical protein
LEFLSARRYHSATRNKPAPSKPGTKISILVSGSLLPNHYLTYSKKPKCLITYIFVFELNILKWPRPRGLGSEASYNHYFTYSKKPNSFNTYIFVYGLNIFKCVEYKSLELYRQIKETNVEYKT